MCMNELLVRSGSTSLVSLDPRRSLLKVAEDTLDLLERAAQVVGDLLGQHMRFWQFRRILEAFVLEPEDVEATLVTGCELLVGEHAPATVGIRLLVPQRLSLVAVLGVVAGDELEMSCGIGRSTGTVEILPQAEGARIIAETPSTPVPLC